MKHYKITAWAMVLAAACMTGCTEKQLADDYSVTESSVVIETEIAEKCGCSSYVYFTKQFKKSKNMTPSEFREKSVSQGGYYQS